MDLLAPGTIRPPKEHPLTRSFPTARKAIAISQVLSIDPFYRQNRSLLRRIPPCFRAATSSPVALPWAPETDHALLPYGKPKSKASQPMQSSRS